MLERDAFTSSLMNSEVAAFWAGLSGTGYSPRLAERVWASNRCMQLNCQLIASMPLRFSGTYKPEWVSNPDPVWFPNGIGDAVFAAMWSMYGWGDAFLLVTLGYANEFPQSGRC
jgi:hypothetical protein